MGRKVNIWKRGNIIFKTSLFQLISNPKPYEDPTKNSIKESARNIISEIVSTEIGHVLTQFVERNLMLNSFRQSGCCQRWCSTCLQETICNLTSQKKKSFKIYINHLIYKLLVLYMLLQIKWLIGWVSNSRKQGSSPTSFLSVTLIRLFAFFLSHLDPSAEGIV